MWMFAADTFATPGVTVRLRFRPEVTLSSAGDNELHVGHLWGGMRLAGISPEVYAALEDLAQNWCDPQSLTDELLQQRGIDSLGRFLWSCQEVAFLLQVRLLHDNIPLLTLVPTSRAAHIPELEASSPHNARLSPFALLHVIDTDVVLESALSHHRILVHDAAIRAVISVLGSNAPVEDHELGALMLRVLAGTGMLDGTEVQTSGLDSFLINSAETADLLFHQRSRFGTHDGPFGAGFPFLLLNDPPAAWPPPMSDRVLPLPIPDEASVAARDMTLTEALEGRCSIRHFAESALGLDEVAEFLFRCVRVRGHYGPTPESGMPYVALDRPVPSGGGLHELELYVVAGNVEHLPSGVYHYRSSEHALELVNSTPSTVSALLDAAVLASATESPPPVLIKVTSRFYRLTWKYHAIAYATTLKNVGVLYQTMYLVATSMGLAPCALGSGDEVMGRMALGSAASSELGVGEFMLGRLPLPNARTEVRESRRRQPTWRDDVHPDWGQPERAQP